MQYIAIAHSPTELVFNCLIRYNSRTKMSHKNDSLLLGYSHLKDSIQFSHLAELKYFVAVVFRNTLKILRTWCSFNS